MSRSDAAAISAIAAENAASLRLDGARKPLTFRTYWRAAASTSPVVAGTSLDRRVRMLLHMRRSLAATPASQGSRAEPRRGEPGRAGDL